MGLAGSDKVLLIVLRSSCVAVVIVIVVVAVLVSSLLLPINSSWEANPSSAPLTHAGTRTE